VLSGQYGDTAQLTANPPTVNPGGTVTIAGSGFPGDCILGISVGSCAVADSIGTVTTDADGNFTLTWNVPDDQAPGDVLICTTLGSVQVTANVTVQSSAGTTLPPSAGGGHGGSGTLPATGSQVLPFVAGGVLLLVVGSLLVLSTRKRNAAR
jgi:LPXTG-motif cell wall-anchored protein